MLREKVAVITGASRGLGAAMAEAFARQGANVALIYAGNTQMAETVCASCRELGAVQARAYRCDVSDFQQSKEIVSQILSDFGHVDILVNNAGVTKDGLCMTMQEADFDRVLDVNLKGAFHMIRHLSRFFVRQKGGCIINISSVSGLMGNVGQCNYAASKAGLIGLTKSVAKELAGKGVRCNAIAPGFIDTDMTVQQRENPLLSLVPLGRMGQPEEVAQAAVFLASAAYITGEVLRVDGGIAM